MMIVNLIANFPTQESLEILQGEIMPAVTVLAQNFKDNADLFGQMEEAFKNFVETGQVWALLIGMFFGYMFKSLTGF